MDDKFLIDAEKPHLLVKVWNNYPEILQNGNEILPPPPIEKVIGDLFSMGEFYYYVINFADSTLSGHHPNILTMHGLKHYPHHLKEIIDLVHPADLNFIMEAERMSIEKMREIDGFKHQQELKTSYCFRMKTAKGNYEMFHHQALHTSKSDDGKLLQAVNIHTNIQHITKENSYIVLVQGIGSRNDFHQMHCFPNSRNLGLQELLTKREAEVLTLLVNGNPAKEIADRLSISYHTVTTHRKNIFRKTGCRKVSELVKIAIEYGYI